MPDAMSSTEDLNAVVAAGRQALALVELARELENVTQAFNAVVRKVEQVRIGGHNATVALEVMNAGPKVTEVRTLEDGKTHVLNLVSGPKLRAWLMAGSIDTDAFAMPKATDASGAETGATVVRHSPEDIAASAGKAVQAVNGACGAPGSNG